MSLCKLACVLFILLLTNMAETKITISWNESGMIRWSSGCDFRGEDLKSFKSREEDCGPQCQSTRFCTHFTWTDYEGGKCWLKTGGASESNAIPKSNSTAVCGFLKLSVAMSWNHSGTGVRWSYNCDFIGADVTHQSSSADNCGTLCQITSPCTHFTWTAHKGGTCWMKSGTVTESNAVLKTNYHALCGLLRNQTSGISGSIKTKATYWTEESNASGCQLPTANYDVTDAVALGQDPTLQQLVWRSGLCGQVLRVDCGKGAVDAVVVSPCNLGSPTCGIDLLGKTWRNATSNQAPGSAQCSVSLPTRNPIHGSGPRCFHRPNSDIDNGNSTIIGVLNTSGKISSSAWIAGVQGTRGNDGWFAFQSNGTAVFRNDSTVVFNFEDSSTSEFKLKDCANGGRPMIFNSTN